MDITKPQISGVELHAIVTELQKFNESKIVQVYQSEDTEFFIELYNRTHGKTMLRIIPGKYMYITTQKPKMESPSGFCMFLRKHLINAIIGTFEQVDAQRIIHMTIRSKETSYNMYIEFFSKGNIIVCESKTNTVLQSLTKEEFKARSIKSGEKYIIPPLELNIFTATRRALELVINDSKESSLVKILASSIGLGGLMAEEICVRAGIAKTTEKLTLSQSVKISQTIQSLLKELPKGYLYDNIIAPIELKSKSAKSAKIIPTFNQALDESLSTSSAQREKLKKEAQYQEKIKSVQHILSEQQKKLKEVESLTDEHKKRGDWFYEHYSEVKTLLTKVQQEKEAHGWQAVQKFLSGLKKIKKIDLKDKQISLEAK